MKKHYMRILLYNIIRGDELALLIYHKIVKSINPALKSIDCEIKPFPDSIEISLASKSSLRDSSHSSSFAATILFCLLQREYPSLISGISLSF
ncbi:MAG: hypothetical protein J1F12_08940 [Muribaculaceae bacterium]|nr:hypothetical protein [Muribaculaceae bacterium]